MFVDECFFGMVELVFVVCIDCVFGYIDGFYWYVCFGVDYFGVLGYLVVGDDVFFE